MTDKTLGITAEMDIDDVLSGLSALTQELGDIPTSINTDINLADSDTSLEEVSDLKTDLNDVDGMVATPTIDVEGDTSEITTAEEEMTELDNEVATPTIDIDAGSIEEAAASASSLGDYLTDDAGDAGDLSGKLSETSDSASNASGSVSTMDAALSGVASLGIAATLDAAVTSAGNFNDSWNRLAISMGEGNETISQTKSEWGSTISSIQGATDRTAGDIRIALTNLGTAGIQSKETLVTSVDAISGHAYAIGSTVSAVSSTFESAVQRSTFSARNLISLGLNANDVVNGTGMTVDQLSKAWKTADSNQKALWLSEIMNAHDGANANNDYKNSWNDINDKLKASLAYLSIIGGQLLLPGAKAATTNLSNALKGVAEWVDKLSPGMKSFLGNILGLGAGIAVISGLVQGFKKVHDALNIVGNIKAVGSAITSIPEIPSKIKDGFGKVKDAAGKAKDGVGKFKEALGKIPEIPGKVKDSFTKIKDVATSAGGTVKDKLGNSIDKLNGIPSKVSDSFSKVKDLASNVGGAVKDKLGSAIDKLKGVPSSVSSSFTKLKTLASDVGGTVTSKLGGAITKLKGVPSTVTSSFSKLKDVIKAATTATDENTAAENRGIIAKGRAAIASAAKAAKEAISTAATKIATAAQAAFNFVMDANPIMLVVIAIAALAAGLIYLYTHVKSVHDAINNFWNALKGFWSWLTHIDPNTIWKWIWAGVQDALKKVTDPWNNFVNFIKSLPSSMQKWGQDIIQGLINGVLNGIPGLKSALSVVDALFPHSPPKEGPLANITAGNMQSWASNISQAGVSGFSEMTSGVASTLSQMSSNTSSTLSQIQSTVSSFSGQIQSSATQMFSIGQSIINNLTSGLENGIPDLSNVFSQISNMFPHSPPKEGPLASVKAENMKAWTKNIAQAGVEGLSHFTGYMDEMVQLPRLSNLSSPGLTKALTSSQNSQTVINLSVEEGAVQVHGNADKNVVNQGGNLLGNSISSSLQKGAVTNGLKPTVILRR